MKVYLDGIEIPCAGESLACALRAGADEASRRRRVIIEVHADGRPAPAQDLSSPPAHEPYAEELRFVSSDPFNLVRTTLHDAADALEASRADHDRAAEMLLEGRASDAMEPMAAVVGVWQVVRRAVDEGCALLDRPVEDALRHAAGSLPTPPDGELMARLTERLTTVKQALAAKDWSALSDLLAYDLREDAVVWTDVLRALASNSRDTERASA